MAVAHFQNQTGLKTTASHALTLDFSTPDFKALIGDKGWARLHPAIRRRFSDHTTNVVYKGDIDIHANFVGKVFAALLMPFGGPLPFVRNAHMMAKVDVFPNPHGGVVWRRQFLRPNKPPLQVESVKQMHTDGNLLECVKAGPFGGIAMILDVYEHEHSLCFKSLGYFLKLGPFKIPISHIFTPGHTLVEHIDEAALGGGCFRFRLTMRHKWFGKTVCQDGVFVDPFGSEEEPNI